MSTASSPPKPRRLASTISAWVGVALYLVLGILYASSGLLVPLVGVLVLGLVWVAGWYLVVRLMRSRPLWVPVVAIGGALFWWVLITLGEAVFSWSA